MGTSKLKVFITLISFFIISNSWAQFITISGYITEKGSGESMISASVFEQNSRKGTVSNSFGFYSLTLPAGNFDLQFSYVGYSPEFVNLKLNKDTIINVQLDPALTLSEVTVTGHQKIAGVQSTQMSAIEVPISQIKMVPTLFGEADLIKALQLLPGVQSGTEGFTGFYVRGGGPDENLFLLDGIPLYNVNHLAGFFSVFNPDAIKNVTLYKGNFPARFGGRLSSVIDVHMNDGNNEKIHGNFSIGAISSKINIDGPINKGKTTFNFSARRTYGDLIIKPVMWYASLDQNMDIGDASAGYYFYDINAKINHKFSDTDRLIASFYMGDDVIYSKFKDSYGSNEYFKTESYMKMDMNWGNLMTAVRWNHLISNKLFMNTTAAYTRYRYDMGVGSEFSFTDLTKNPPQYDYEDIYIGYKSGIEDLSFKLDFDYSPHPNHDVKFGFNYLNHTFKPGVSVAQFKMQQDTNVVNTDTTIGNNNVGSHETMWYAEDNIDLGHAFKANLGLHLSTFNVQGKFYSSLQPRISVRALFSDNLSFKAGYAAMSQYIHLLSNSNISLPTDLWVPVTKRIEPMRSHQVSAGFFYNLNNIVDLSLEAYYKTMFNLLEYRDGATFLGSSTGWEDKVAMGRGWAYGIEFLAQKTIGNTTGWLGYTWAKTERLFDRPGEELNFGRVFPAKYDRRHDISLVVSHKFSKRFDAALTWVYATGNAGTLGLQVIPGTEVPDTYPWEYNGEITYIESRNNFRMPAYHRMDLAFNFHKQKKHGMRTWNLSFYNAYNNNNPFIVLPMTESDVTYNPITNEYIWTSRKTLKQYSIFPIIPSLSYSYKW